VVRDLIDRIAWFVPTLRPVKDDDRSFIEGVYVSTQRPIIEHLFGWRGDEVEKAKFDEVYDSVNTSVIVVEGEDAGWMTVHTRVDQLSKGAQLMKFIVALLTALAIAAPATTLAADTMAPGTTATLTAYDASHSVCFHNSAAISRFQLDNQPLTPAVIAAWRAKGAQTFAPSTVLFTNGQLGVPDGHGSTHIQGAAGNIEGGKLVGNRMGSQFYIATPVGRMSVGHGECMLISPQGGDTFK
jgi:hypothetical protein